MDKQYIILRLAISRAVLFEFRAGRARSRDTPVVLVPARAGDPCRMPPAHH